MKEKLVDDIKKINKINVMEICKEYNINYFNLYNGNTTLEKTKKVHNEYINRIKKVLKEIEK